LSLPALQQIVPKVKLIVQATPVGTWPNVNDSLDFPFAQLTTEHRVYDLVYNPPTTAFLKMAQQAGAKTQNGLTMLAAQAAQFLKLCGFTTTPTELLQTLQS